MEEWLDVLLCPAVMPILLGSLGDEECLPDMLEGVWERRSEFCSSAGTPDARSSLLPARSMVRFGDPSARASLRKVGSALNESREARSYTRIAPAAPR